MRTQTCFQIKFLNAKFAYVARFLEARDFLAVTLGIQ